MAKDEKKELIPAELGGGEIATEGQLASDLAKAEQQGSIWMAAMMAKKFPRDEKVCEEKLSKVCELDEFAGNIDDLNKPSAYYTFPRGGQMISGPSIRMARELNRIWGNRRTGMVITHEDEEKLVIMGYSWDLENNQFESSQDVVRKLIQKRTDEGTQWKVPDERDLRELTNRRAAIVIRNCILTLHPRHVIDKAVQQCKETVAGNSPEELFRRTQLMLDAFVKWGITSPQVERYLKKPLGSIVGNDLADLRGIYEAIRDGQLTPDDRNEMFGKPAKEIPEGDRPPLSEEQMRPAADQTPSHSQPEPAKKQPPAKPITDAQRRKLFATLKKSKKNEKDLKRYIDENYNMTSTKEITQGEVFDDVLGFAEFIPVKDPPPERVVVGKKKAEPEVEEEQVMNHALTMIEASTKTDYHSVKDDVMHHYINRIKTLKFVLPITAALNNKRASLGI